MNLVDVNSVFMVGGLRGVQPFSKLVSQVAGQRVACMKRCAGTQDVRGHKNASPSYYHCDLAGCIAVRATPQARCIVRERNSKEPVSKTSHHRGVDDGLEEEGEHA